MKIPPFKIHRFLSGIGRKFFLYFFIFSILPLLSISYIGYRISENIVIKQNLHYLKLQNELVENRFRSVLQTAKNQLSLNNIANAGVFDWIQKRLSQPLPEDCEDAKHIRAFLEEQTNKQQSFTAFALVDRNKKILCASDSLFSRILDQTLPGFSLPPAVIVLERDSAAVPRPVIILSTPVYADPKKNRGYIFAELNNHQLQDILHYFSSKEQASSIYILDKRQHVLFSTSNAAPVPFSRHVATRVALQQPRGVFSYPNGEKVLRVVRPFAYLDWYIVSETEFNKALADLLTLRNEALFGVGALLVLLIGLAFYVSQRISVPLKQLVYAAQDIGDGLLDTPIQIHTQDEIGQLAREFDEMRQKLLDYYENLEQKVRERTLELENAQFQIMHQEKMASLGLMAAGIAHEIGNPLTSISSLTQLLMRRLKDDTNREYLTTIMRNIDRISKIVRELVDFSRPSNYEPRLTNVNDVIEAAVGIVRYDSRSKRINFHLDLAPDIPKLYLVADQLLQVFLNILINAVDAMEECGSDLFVKTEARAHQIIIVIKDTGCGIPKDKLNRIFEPFYTTKEVGKGTGLGLSVSYGIIRNWKGEIKVESELGRGSIFTIILPGDEFKKVI